MPLTCFDPPYPRVLPILDIPHPHTLDPIELARVFAGAGVGMIQLRAKSATPSERRSLAQAIAPICAGRLFMVNDDLDLAESGIPGVSGVHLGQTDLRALGPTPADAIRRLRGRGLLVGLSTHDLDQVDRACSLDPDYLGFGPIFATRSKLDPDPTVGIERLRAAVARADRPLIAIGGIDLERSSSVLEAGASAIAVISALVAPTLEQTRRRVGELLAGLA